MHREDVEEVGLFRAYERTKPEERKGKDGAASSRLSELNPKTQRKAAKSAATPAGPVPTETAAPDKKVVKRASRYKDAPTPTRAQREAERMERLHPTHTPREQRKADREARAKQRTEAWDQMESSRERTLVRDYVDTRWTVAEFMLPAMMVVMAGVMFTMQWPTVSTYIALMLWVLMFATMVNIFLLWRGFKRLLDERYPGASRRGLLMYMFNRSLMIRRFRRPAPEINRGDPVR